MRTSKQTFKVVMLPTKIQAQIFNQIVKKDKLEYYNVPQHVGAGDGYHLYIISNDEINTRDVMLQNGNIPVLVTRPYVIMDSDVKVIASTDKSFTPNSWISESFVKAYIKAYNEGSPITEVDLEMREYDGSSSLDFYSEGRSLLKEPKTRPDGSVVIRESKPYSREEVISLVENSLSNIGYDIKINTYPDGTIQDYDITEWISKNL